MTDEQKAKWLKLRRTWERRIANKIIKAALAAGLRISVWNGGDEPEISKGDKFKAISDACLASDEDRLVFFNADDKRVGWVWLVYGNSGWDTIADYTDNELIRNLLKPIEGYSDSLSEQVPGYVN